MLREKIHTVEEELNGMRSQIQNLAVQNDQLENRMRRGNILFHGLEDAANETWSESEAKVVAFCNVHLGVDVTPTQIERAHRVGHTVAGKTRPVIVKFCDYKLKERLLSLSYKLKGTNFAIRQDYSPGIRNERKRLVEFGVGHGGQFQLRFNKLHLDGNVYQYDAASKSVKRTATPRDPGENSFSSRGYQNQSRPAE
ncbi:uncharacterized protein LOC135389609 [Ornithodoros turicata]|uniref:uncharacterized protein LOC135389609 n=1 Tax=Ornithodoros turicata TaxID=34597 RepID=UPI00313986EF